MKKNLLTLLLLSLFALSSAFAQGRKITGTVTDPSGQTLPGVSVKAEGATAGVQTNAQGRYSIEVPKNTHALVFSFIGMTTQTIPLSADNNLNLQMTDADKALSEVVVVGYGTAVLRTNAVGSIGQASAKDIQDKPSANAFDALQGRVAGLSIFTSSGEPSSTPSLQIDGVSSLSANTTPLVVLDGTVVDPTTIQTLNPDDIQSATVLRDATSTSIYGSRAANGVIYITTKTGSANTPASISVSSQLGTERIANPTYYGTFMNSAQWSAFELASGVYTQAALNTLLANNTADTKWYQVYYKPSAPIYNENMSISGGSDKTTYFLSAGYFKEDGLAYRSTYSRYTMRSNIASRVNDWFKVGLNLGLSYDNRQTNQFATNSLSGGLAVLAPPIYSATNAAGVPYEFIPGWGQYAPYYYEAKHPDALNNVQINPTGYIELTPIKGLTIKSQAGVDFFDRRESTETLPSYLGSLNNGAAGEFFTRTSSLTFTNTAEYKFAIKNDHHFTILGGQEYTDYSNSNFQGTDTGQSDDRLMLLAAGPNTKATTSSIYEYDYQSLFARLSYDYKGRYFLEGSVRNDKSSKFGANNRSATFYSVGASWKIKQEKFLKDVNWVSDLTIRASTGTTGNSNFGTGTAIYQQLGAVAISPYNGSNGYVLTNAGDPNLTWETVRNTQVGFTGTFFNKLNVDVSFYLKNTSNMLLSVPFVGTSGFSSVLQNTGGLQNKGADIDLSYTVWSNNAHRAYVTPHVQVNVNANKVTALFNGLNNYADPNTGLFWALGKPISYVEPIWAGVNPSNGLPQWYNPGSDIATKTTTNGVTNTFSTTLQQNTGTGRYATSQGGFGIDAGYEGFSLSANFSYVAGKYITNNDQYFVQNPSVFTGYNQQTAILNYWQNPGDVTTYPKLGQQFTQFDSRLIQDASFIRLKTLTLGYVVPKSIIEKTKVIKRFEVDLIGRNILTFTKYTGIDPEVNSNIGLGTDPNTKQYSLNVKATF